MGVVVKNVVAELCICQILGLLFSATLSASIVALEPEKQTSSIENIKKQ